MGAFVGIDLKGVIKIPTDLTQNYGKKTHNGAYPQYSYLEQILNHLRVFHSDCYKIIPQFNLRTTQGVYYNDRFTFLEIFVFAVKNVTVKHDLPEIPHIQRVKWFIKQSSAIFDIPFKIAVESSVTLQTKIWDKVDR